MSRFDETDSRNGNLQLQDEYNESHSTNCSKVSLTRFDESASTNCSTMSKTRIDESASRNWSTTFKYGNYRVQQSVFDEIMAEAEIFSFVPEVDAFSSFAHRRLPVYWSAHNNAFNKQRSIIVLWIHPPFQFIGKDSR